MSIRKLEEKDIDTLAEFWWNLQLMNMKYDERYYEVTSKEDALEYKKRYYKDIISNPFFFPLVMESEDNKIIGYMITEIKEREPFYKAYKIARIREVFLIPEHQRKGLFRIAYQKMMEFIKEHDIFLIDAEIDLSNPVLARYYKVNLYKRGFRLISWVKDTEEYFKKMEEKRKKPRK
ncbi:MAG: GNAT family N-acetyltransferase [Candidatus Helarchaeota archaeon]